MKNYFAFTRGQQTGVFVWVVVISGLILTTSFLSNQLVDERFVVNPEDLEYVQLNTQNNSNNFDNSTTINFDKNKIVLFDFDPNKLTLTGWEDLGFSEKQAQAIVNYRDKYGPFKKKEELKKIFVISEEKYQELEPHIKIENSLENKTHLNKLTCINLATTADLEALPGIGSKYAQRILNFRNALGGFTSMTQLHEVYNMTEEVYQILVEHLEIGDTEIKQIKINSATKDQIDKHPYIDFDVTAAILKERELNKIESLDFLLEKGLLTNDELERLKPYISFE